MIKGIYSHLAVFLIVVFCFLGCSTGLKNISKNYIMNEEPNKSVIIGKSNIKQEGAIGITTWRTIRLKNATTNEQLPAPPIGDEYFFISLDKGEYIIESSWIGFGTLGAMGYGYPVHLNLRFKANPNEIIYIGDLTVTHKFKPFKEGLIGSDISISDTYEGAVNEFRKQYPNIKNDVKHSLMK